MFNAISFDNIGSITAVKAFDFPGCFRDGEKSETAGFSERRLFPSPDGTNFAWGKGCGLQIANFSWEANVQNCREKDGKA